HVADLRARIPDANLRLRGQGDAELREHLARLEDGAGTVGGRLVPYGREPEHRPRVAGAERAHDDVVDGRRGLDGDELGATPAAAEAELGDGRGAIGEEALLVDGIDPGARHYLGAVHRPHVLLVRLDNLVHHLGGQEALVDEERLERPNAVDDP